MYLVKIPIWLQRFYRNRLFQYHTKEKILYITFDDGPNKSTTPFILSQLKKYGAKASFFCIGKNVELEKELYQQICNDGHLIGSHTYHHLNGWQENVHTYVTDVIAADRLLESDFFRPPYGRMRKRQERVLLQKRPSLKIVMWSVLSGDFDTNINSEKCLQNVLGNAKEGDIVVFHDSDKASERLQYVLPKTLEHYARLGYRFDVLH
ncbi:MAG: polysaccharide deacetylase family protein [Pseudopedobacter saltans]|uniref:Polysaccharide deacetylase family protein n=1 Tax=Pseudopedobacter saltans TaxID=151895 RepID=A0A2W5F5W5_9SPHI|nr:MAG: polysaccharide deacetylase family protein [Pseudopedobacter saltans]